jgi:hypothetical protein
MTTMVLLVSVATADIQKLSGKDNGKLPAFTVDGPWTGWRVSFSPACPGLHAATAISFVTSAAGGLDQYDSIMLDDGTRCYFDRVNPTVAR